MNYEKAIDEIWTVISNEEIDDWFSEHYDEELEKCDVFMEKGDVNEIPLKTLKEYVDDYNSYYIMREVIESIKKFKEDFEKQVRAKEAYKKVVKKQSDKIKELKKENEKLKEEQYDNMEKLAEEQYMYLVGFTEFDNLIKAEQENKKLKEEIEKLKKERYTDKQLEELIKEVDFEDIDCDCLPVENEFNIENWLHDIKEQIEEKIDKEDDEEEEEEVNYNELNEEERKEINDIMWKCSIHNPENWKNK